MRTMRTIRIDDEVWQELKKRAVPLEDTPNAVLRRLLGLDGEETRERSPRRGGITPKEESRLPILEALVEMGGRGRVNDVLARVEKKIEDRLKRGDYEKVSTGEFRWRNNARGERASMAREGLLKPMSGSARGYWEITEKGRNVVKASSS
jgi:hypothetical protein